MFECKKILNGRGNVPEPEVHTVGSSAITAGMALNLSGGVLVKATGAPTHIALADAAANTKVACYAVLPGMIFDVPVSAAPTSLKEGVKVTVAGTGIEVTATTTDGVATIVNLNGATKVGDIIQVKF